MVTLCAVLVLAVALHTVQGQRVPLRGPPQFELNPQYSDSYLPASMQIIAYLTEMMKYELRPSAATTTTTTPRPTPSHRPGLYAPNRPPGASAYFSRTDDYAEYVQKLHPLADTPESPHFETADFLKAITKSLGQLEWGLSEDDVKDLDLLGQGPTRLHKLVNGLDEEDVEDDDHLRADRFSQSYDDSNSRASLGKAKRVPPTRAYVTLLSLYDTLNKESKKQGLNKFNGFSETVVKDLSEKATGTSAYQLKYVLEKIVEKKNTDDASILKKIDQLVKDLGQDDSYINNALRYIPPLPFEL